MLARFKEWGNTYGLVPLRLALGVIFTAHGLQKVFGLFGGNGLSATVAAFHEHLGIPPFLAYIAIFTELIGGVCVLIGFMTRWASLGLAIVMLVAIFHVHLANGFFLNSGNIPGVGNGIEYTVALLGMALTLFLTGPRRPSLDSKC